MQPQVVTLGETMGVFRFSGPFGIGTTVTPSMAGAESNVAIALTRLGHSTTWVGSLGEDLLGEGIFKTLRGEGVAVEHVSRRPEPTGILISSPASAHGKRVDYHRCGTAGRVIAPEQIDAALGQHPRLLHLTGITPALGQAARESVEHAVRRARELSIPVSLDINYRARLWSEKDAAPVLEQLARQADILFGGTQELALVTGLQDPVDAMVAARSWGPRSVVWKSAEAARELCAEGSVEVGNEAVVAVDPIGAGDAFVAGWLSAWLESLPAKQRLTRAHLLGAATVGRHGDWEGLPSRQELQRLESREDGPGRSDDVQR